MISVRFASSFALALGLFAAAPRASAQPEPGDDAPKPSAEPEDDRAPVRATEVVKREQEPAETEKAKRPSEASIVVQTAGHPAEETRPAQPRQRAHHFSIGSGFSGSIVESKGYDPYSRSNTLPMMTVFGTFTPWVTRPFSVHLAAGWDYGGETAYARGNASSLDVHRLALGLEGRYSPISRMSFYVRGMPAVIHVNGSVNDPSLVKPLEAASWTWGVDVTGGAAAKMGSIAEHVSFWIALDLGYRFAGPTSMKLRPGDLGDDDQGRNFGEVPMPELDLSGFTNRFSIYVTF